MNNIEILALQIYKSNLLYFEKNHFELYKRIITLEASISQGIYKERYALEYKEEGYFDVRELSTDCFMYGENSNKYTEKLLRIVDTKKTGCVFEAQQRFPIKEEELEEIGDFKNFHSSLWATAKILFYNSKVAPKDSSEMEKIYKFIFLETGLGLHIPIILEKYNIPISFILEKNLEIFRLSLFLIDYKKISLKTKLYFSIMEDFELLQSQFSLFLSEAFNYNLYIKFIPFSSHYEEDLAKLQSITLSQNYIMFPYQAYLARSISVIQKISQNNHFLNVSKMYNDTLFTSIPILVLASGPSLQNNTFWIKQNQDRFLIITVLSACAHLFHHNIQPDIVIHIDPQESASLKILDTVDKDKLAKSVLILGSSVHQSVVSALSKNKIFFIEDATTYKVNFGYFTLPSVGEYAAMLPLILGAKNIFLLGLDLSLDANTMKDHIDLHIGSQTVIHTQKESVEFQNSLCYVKGNFCDFIPSKPNFRLSITQFNHAIRFYKQANQVAYNLSNGAFLNETIPLEIDNVKINDFKVLKKPILKKEIENFLITNSSCELRDIDVKYIEEQMKKTESILKYCQKMRAIIPKEKNNYLFKKLIPLVNTTSNITSSQKCPIEEILFEYFKISLSFVFDIFNTKNLTNTKKHIQAVDTIMIDEIEKIVKTYKKTLDDYFMNLLKRPPK